MKFLIVLLLVIGTVPVYAQLETTTVPEIENPQECMQSEIRGGKGWIPFSIKMFYDTTKDHIMSVEHQGDTNPVIQQNDNVMIFQSDGEDTYKLSTQLNYDSSQKRAIYFEYWSEGNAMHTEIINYNGNSFCRLASKSLSLSTSTPLSLADLTRYSSMGTGRPLNTVCNI